MTGRLAAAALVLLVLLAGAPAARAAPPAGVCAPVALGAPFGANVNHRGVVDLYFFRGGGADVHFYECTPQRVIDLGTRSAVTHGYTAMLAATTWRCDRRTRVFAAAVTAPDGTFVRGLTSVRTPSCARRFALRLPRRVARGAPLTIRLRDTFGLGAARVRLCVRAPGARRRCRLVHLAVAQSVARWTLRATRAGSWAVDLRAADQRVRRRVAVGGVAAAPTAPAVLVTGDSTVQGIDTFLADELGSAADVTSDVRPGSALSDDFDRWLALARHQVARQRPRLTVISRGAAEGFPMTGPDGHLRTCCGNAWIGEYARRVRLLARVYGGAGPVVWLTVVAPRDPDRVPIVAAVNAAILRAAAGVSGVRVLRLDQRFSPHGYQEVIRYRGRDVDVREPDGLHLNVAGAAIAAHDAAAVVRRLLRA